MSFHYKTYQTGFFRIFNRQILKLLKELTPNSADNAIFSTIEDNVDSISKIKDYEHNSLKISDKHQHHNLTEKKLKETFWPLFNSIIGPEFEGTKQELEDIYEEEWYLAILSMLNNALSKNTAEDKLIRTLTEPLIQSLSLIENDLTYFERKPLKNRFKVYLKKKKDNPVHILNLHRVQSIVGRIKASYIGLTPIHSDILLPKALRSLDHDEFYRKYYAYFNFNSFGEGSLFSGLNDLKLSNKIKSLEELLDTNNTICEVLGISYQMKHSIKETINNLIKYYNILNKAFKEKDNKEIIIHDIQTGQIYSNKNPNITSF